MASALIGRIGWPVAATLAAALLVVLALHGERPEPGLARFKAAGLMTTFTPAEAREVDISKGQRTWRFRRDGTLWRRLDGSQPAAPDDRGRIDTDRIDAALKLLRDSGPLRTLSADEVGKDSAGEFDLGDKALAVTVRGPGKAAFEIRFGARNPLGSARYARASGVEGVPLLSAYVAEAWEQLIGAAQP